MDAQVIAKYTGLPASQLQRFFGMSSTTVIKDPEYIALLRTIDRPLLERTLPHARAAYENGLPGFQAELERRFGIVTAPMSAYTLGNWVVGALQYPDNTDQILNMHRNVPAKVVAGGLEDLLSMLKSLPEGGKEWQRALCLLSIPLMLG